MKKLKSISLAIIIVLTFAVAIIYSQKGSAKTKSDEVLNFNYDNSKYEPLWKNADSLSKKGLSRSVLNVVDGIYEKAKKEVNAPQFAKAVIYKLKFESYIEEEAYVKAIHKISEEIKTTQYPIKPLMHSLLASIYWQYYINNRWKFNDRTRTVSFNSDDLRTWDLNKIIQKTIQNYSLSLEEENKLKRTPINIYDEIITVTDNSLRKFRPTLYDFLAHRAVDFFMSEEPDIIRPAYKFEIDQKQYLSSYTNFAKIKISSKDTISMKLYALTILQYLIKFHMNDKDPAALIAADLKRLKFVKSHSVLENTDSLYLNELMNLEKKFKTHASYSEIAYEIAMVYYGKGLTYQPLVSDTNKWMLKKAYDICTRIADKTEETNYGIQSCKYLKSIIEQKSLHFQIENANIPDRPFMSLITYKNLSNVFVRIVKTDPEWYHKESQKLSHEKLIDRYLKQTKINEWSQSLKDDGDFQQHAAEIKIPALPSGFYAILIGSSKNFSTKEEAVAFSNCWVSNISYIKRANDKSETEYFILDRTSGKPLKNVAAQIFYKKYDYNSRKYQFNNGKLYTTDDNGYFKLPYSKSGQNYFIKLTKGEDRLFTEPSYQYSSRPDKKKLLKTIFFTDRSIYRPGQTIYFKGITLETYENKTEIKPDYQSTITFKDANYQKIEDISLISNEYGTFSGTFTAPTGVLNGTMSISTSHGRHSFLVEEYKRPKFEVKVNPIKGEYRLNDLISVSGTAKAYAGSNIDNAYVKYRVVRRAIFPHWWFWCPWYFPAKPEMEITSGTGKTDEKGKFTLEFKAIPDKSISKKAEPKFNYTVYVDVTDINGETHSAEQNVIVGYTALNLSVNIPLQLDMGTKEKFLISTINLAGEYQYAKGNIAIYKLKHPERLLRTRLWSQPDIHLIPEKEFKETFPLDPIKDEGNVHKWDKGEKVLKTAFNTQKDSLLKINNLSKWEPGQYVLEADLKDKYGEEVKDIRYFTLYSTKGKKVPVHAFDWFSVLKNQGDVGETITVLLGSKAKGVSALYEVENKGTIIQKKWLTLNSEQKKFEIPVIEDYRGNFSIHFTFVKENRSYQQNALITVPYTNKQLDIEFETFRNKLLPGQKEEWKLKIKGKKGEKAAAELLASMYDASLDAFTSHNWLLDIYKTYYTRRSWDARNSFTAEPSSLFEQKWNTTYTMPYRKYDRLNLFGYSLHQYDQIAAPSFTRGGYAGDRFADAEVASQPSASKSRKMKVSASTATDKFEADLSGVGGLKEAGHTEDKKIDKKTKKELAAVKARKNFNETAFFFPHLQTNKEGDIVISFTMPEALTRWRFMGLAHTKDLKIGQIEKEVITQKDIMVMPNPPRFFRENDRITFSAKVSNVSKKDLSGDAQLLLFDALTMKPVDKALGNTQPARPFTVKKEQSTAISWNLSIPDGMQAIMYKIVAKAGKFTDGEEMVIPVLTNRMLVTETLPLPIRGKQTKKYTLKKLADSGKSKTLKNHKLTLEYTTNPAWYAIQALPYLMEYPYDCSEQIFSRFYANSIASHIANSSPRIKQVFDSWKNITPDALLSNLEKNQELKSLLLQETPWVLNAKNESQRKRNVALLFDLNKMGRELSSALFKLQKLQVSNGGWPWFKGMPDNRYITQHIVTGMGHLDHLGVKNIREDNKTWNMVKNAVQYLDNRIREDYEWLLKHTPDTMDKNHLGGVQIQYLYARSYFLNDVPIAVKNKKAFEYYKGQAKKFWLENNRYLQGMIALALHRMNDKITPPGIMKSLKENAIYSEEMGMYWNDIRSGYYWYQMPIETIALLVEAFSEVTQDIKSVEALKVWLLKNKQTNDWKTTKATTEACYALLLKGTDWLAKEPIIEITVGDMKIDPKKIPEVKVEAGTGYFKTSWAGSDIKPQMGNVTVKKGDEGVSWGALYWQYFEQLDKITTHETPLKLKKKLFIERNTTSGPVIEPISSAAEKLKVGDKVIVRIELRVDRDMEYIHMKDMRAAGFEPINVISTYKYQDGLGYYESTKDASTNFFISSMQKGTYVFEYPLRVSHMGDFSNGITTIQCMYAPEFASNSEGIRVVVEK